MTEHESTLIIQNIINKALKGQAQPFRTILYWSEYSYYRKQAVTIKLTIKALKQTTNKLFKKYCQDVIAGVSNVTKLLAYVQLLDIIDFYENDLEVILTMIDNYEEYLEDFRNFKDALLGGRRVV